MSDIPPKPPPDPQVGASLEEALSAARELLDLELKLHTPEPDFTDVLSRAWRHEAPEGELEADELPAARHRPSSGLSDPAQLAQVNADARLLLDRSLDGAGGPRRRARAWSRGRSRGWSAGVAAAAAIPLIVLGLGGVALANSWVQTHRAQDELLAQASAFVLEDSRRVLESAAPTPRFPTFHVPMAEAPPRESSTQASPEPPPPADAPKKRPLADRLGELDAQAYAALRAGDRGRARTTFETITRIGRRSEYAELAFAELFALIRQGGGSGELETLWRSYLRRFPRGRYADGVRAGLCRRAKADDKSRCWTTYLDKHPHGAARNEALRELD